MAAAAPVEVAAPASAPAILVVDDNEVKRIALRAMLAPLGYPVVEVDSGRAALTATMTRTFALILMDVRMPTMSGFETAKLCRARDEGALTPIIFITAIGGDETEAASAYASGAVDFIFTPVLADVLRAKVTAFVELFVQSEQLKSSLESITRLNDALRDSDLRTQTVLDNVTDAIFILDEQGRIESVNRSVANLFGYGAEEPIGRPFASMLATEQRAAFGALERMHAAPGEGTDRAGRAVETRGRREDGSTFPMEVERGAMTYGAQTLTLASVRDISERQAHTEALEHLALHDGLTGLANRTLFGDLVSRALEAAKRSNEPHAVLVMDLDGFKQVNDTFGHDGGDALLKQLADRLVESLRGGDTVARLGGDEFGILPAEATDMSAAAALALKIEQICRKGFTINRETVQVSPSIGIALFPDHGESTVSLLSCADLAMYAAKRSGNGHAIFDPVHEAQTTEHLALLVDLRQCVERNELELNYQPQVDLRSGKISGVEALIRWRHPRHGVLAPAKFMPEVERTKLIAPLTRWVLNEALHQQRTWREEGLDLTMAINVSSRSLRPNSGLTDAVSEMTSLWDTPRGRLKLELTEGALIEDAARGVLARLHEMGQTLSIDDFGTGYSSLAYLQRLPVDELKIDRSFVMNLASASDDAIIVRSTIDLAHNLGLSVVAEGVEGEQAARILLGYKCDSAQGFHFGRPSAGEELVALLADCTRVMSRPGRDGRRAGARKQLQAAPTQLKL